MNVRNNIIGFAALLATSLSGGATSSWAVSMIELSVEGVPNQTFVGDCYLLPENGPMKRQKIKGTVPTKFWFPAKAVRCNIQKSDMTQPMRLEVIREGVTEFSQASRSPFKWIIVQSSGPWGRAAGKAAPARPTYTNLK